MGRRKKVAGQTIGSWTGEVGVQRRVDRGAAAALAAGEAMPPGPGGANGDLARAEQPVAKEAARTRAEIAQVEQEVAAAQRQVAHAEQAPR